VPVEEPERELYLFEGGAKRISSELRAHNKAFKGDPMELEALSDRLIIASYVPFLRLMKLFTSSTHSYFCTVKAASGNSVCSHHEGGGLTL
jgi:hypothetical protein